MTREERMSGERREIRDERREKRAERSVTCGQRRVNSDERKRCGVPCEENPNLDSR